MRMTSALIVLGLALAACSSGGEGDTAAAPDEAAATAEHSGMADTMTDAVEKAEAVEDTAMEHKEGVDDAIEAAEEEDPPAEE